MRYAKIMKNDATNGDGVCVSFWTQGCPHRCQGCHNPQTWDFKGGKEAYLADVTQEILTAISANGIIRNFSILGGEPLAPENIEEVWCIIQAVCETYPTIKIYLWTGYTDEELQDDSDIKWSVLVNKILKECEVYVSGRFELAKRDITQKWFGSTNQKVHRRENSN